MADFYRVHTFETKGPNRAETKLFLRARSRLLPSPKKGTPHIRQDMMKIFSYPAWKRKRLSKKKAHQLKTRA